MNNASPFAALTFSLLLPCAALCAQEPSAPPQAEQSSEREVTRLVHLSDGTVLRTRARRAGEQWEVLSGKEWRLLPAESVVRVVDEREALAQARELEAALNKQGQSDERVRRVALADWLASQGLYSESLVQLDRVLALDPDQPDALHLLSSLGARLSLPVPPPREGTDDKTAVVDLLRTACSATPSMREMLVQRLPERAGTEEIKTALREQLVSSSPKLRGVSALAMRRTFPGQAMNVQDVNCLLSRAVLDGSEDVRAEASRALRDVRDSAVAVPTIRALSSRNAKLRENAIAALGAMNYPTAVEPLIRHLSYVAAAQSKGGMVTAGGSIFVGKQTAYVQDFDVEVAQFQAVADPQINVLIEGSVLDARVIGGYTVSYATESRLARNSLSMLTGADPGDTNKSWLDWWEENKGRWVTAPPKTEPRTQGQ